MGKILNEIKYFLKTLLCFLAACLLVPILLLTFLFVNYSNELVYYVLCLKYPQITISKTKKIRSLIDTRRNAGVFNFLVHVKGHCDFDQIRRFYDEHLIGTREKTGQYKFPKLRQQLVNCWSHYGWVKDTSSFNLNNHILLNTSSHRGYIVNDANIQDFVSDLVTKYIPSDLPQWQVIIIPIANKPTNIEQEVSESEISENTHYYMLLKIHHLIIAEEDDLHISEMLMLKDDSDKPIMEIGRINTQKSKLNDISSFVRKPQHIENFLRHIRILILNQWNKFIYEFESLETPDGAIGAKITNLTQLLSVLAIVAVNVAFDYWKAMILKRKKKSSRKRTDYEGRYKTIQILLKREVEKRNLSWQVAKKAACTSLQLSNLTKTWVKIIWQVMVNSLILLPIHLYRELLALRDLIFRGESLHVTTYCSHLSVYLPLIVYAQMELITIFYEIFKAPVNIFEELFQYPSKEENKLHKMSYSGRKIVSFSKSIDGEELRKRLTFSNEIRESDFIMSCLSAALYDYFEFYGKEVPVPKILNTTCRTITKGYFTNNIGNKTDFIGGVVFLQLPLKLPDREHARQIHSIKEQIRRKQIMIYLASIGQTKYDMLTSIFPSVLTKICINYFSSNFPVTITEIHGDDSKFQTIWGQLVEDVLLFRPPQSKTCLSLNIHRFGDNYRLAVMADTQLGPEHTIITRSFEKYMETATL